MPFDGEIGIVSEDEMPGTLGVEFSVASQSAKKGYSMSWGTSHDAIRNSTAMITMDTDRKLASKIW